MTVGRMKTAVEAQMHRNGALVALAVYLYHSTGKKEEELSWLDYARKCCSFGAKYQLQFRP